MNRRVLSPISPKKSTTKKTIFLFFGVYAWVVANYALGTLGGDPQQTTGIIELGGASMQLNTLARSVMEILHTICTVTVCFNMARSPSIFPNEFCKNRSSSNTRELCYKLE
ncbi:hypothetical protein Leryth_023820, partial [Lithospermum erythrorhizon]